MLGRLDRTSLLAAALALGACTRAAPEPTRAPSHPPPAPSPRLDAPLEGGARLFHTAVDDAFWVSHEQGRDRLISAGARFELTPETGEVLAVAWDVDLALRGDPLVGSLAVAAHLGGGFVHWSRNRVFRSDTFTGPLRPVAHGGLLGAGAVVRGARSGLDAVMVFGEAGAAALRKGSDTLEPASEAGLADLVALGPKLGLRVDALGRLASTGDGGATWNDAAGVAGLGSKTVLVQPDALAVETWRGRLPLGADGRFGAMDGAQHGSSHGRNFEPILPGSRADDRNAWWIWRDTPPIQAAVLAGARVAAGRALALAPTALAEVDLATATITRAMTDFPQPGLLCSAVPGPEAPLVVCGWETYQDSASYVLSLRDGAFPPVVERAFSDDGYFVTDDAGALGFVGSCALTPRFFDVNDPPRLDTSEIRPAPRICVRRGPNDWVERVIELPEGREIYGWIPRRDGTAVALVVDGNDDGLPAPKDDEPRVSEQGGVRIVRVPLDVGGLVFSRPSWNPYGMYAGGARGPLGPLVDRRFQVREDGSIEGWVASTSGGEVGGVFAGVVVDPRGHVTAYPPPPRVLGMIVTGDFGLSLTRDGELFETLDHGRSHHAAGRSPVPPASFGGSCSPLGCVIGQVTRLGWGAPRVEPVVYPVKPFEEPEIKAPVRLACAPSGKPELVAEAALVPERSRSSWQTGLGDVITLVREVENVAGEQRGQAALPADLLQYVPPDVLAQIPKSQLRAIVQAALAASAPPGDGKAQAAGKAPPRKASGPALRTHSLVMRAPFDPSGSPVRIDATGADLEEARRVAVTPLLAPKGDLGLLFVMDKHELVVTRDRVTRLPIFEPRRYAPISDGAGTSGLLLGPERALVLGEIRRRMSLEEHGQAPMRPPVFLGQERDGGSRRPMALGRRDDGALGLLLWDGSPPRVVAIAELDPKTQSPRPRAPLAPWSTATTADDPRCKKASGWRALVPIEPSSWLGIDTRALPGVTLRGLGAALVRWSESRVCVEAIDVAAERRPDDGTRSEGHLVVRWEASGAARRGAALLSGGLRQELACKLEPAEEPSR
ncbi:hypothetical protein [Polyangium spumosum]|uniref:WG repeat-containing protein n=1 Tax=Polyangium spumosum TaxID=889282 RepID=A0A6N7PW52_9BACT|nr:hypothetical protein [Polyangium spumosum]MRG95066.1 hypothetical protein [Polyangium spumosum]